MEKRQFRRVKTRQIAKICGKLGVVNDVCDIGMQISTAVSPKKRKIDLSFEVFGQMIELIGMIQWVKWRKQLKSLNEMGVLIKNAPPEYLDYVREISG
jgi:hypothetical protein